MDPARIQAFLRETEMLRAPRRALATFGATRISYHLISPVEDLASKTRLREGTVLSEKPKILTPESFAERFEGFGAEAKEFAPASRARGIGRAIRRGPCSCSAPSGWTCWRARAAAGGCA